MCAIVDANVLRDVFRPNGPEAGEKFLHWLTTGAGVLVIGSRAREELYRVSSARVWAQQALLSGRAKIEDETKVAERTIKLENEGAILSDDPHILALAQISGARLLYSNDRDLQADFKNKALINDPRGKIYSTLASTRFGDSHKRLLSNKELCRTRR